MEIAERLLLVRTKLRESQASFARGLGMKQGSYSDLERGRRDSISESTLMLLEINFGINRDWLLHGTGEMFITPGRAEEMDRVSTLLRKIDDLQMEVDRLIGVIEKVREVVA